MTWLRKNSVSASATGGVFIIHGCSGPVLLCFQLRSWPTYCLLTFPGAHTCIDRQGTDGQTQNMGQIHAGALPILLILMIGVVRGKENARLIVSQIVLDTFEGLNRSSASAAELSLISQVLTMRGERRKSLLSTPLYERIRHIWCRIY